MKVLIIILLLLLLFFIVCNINIEKQLFGLFNIEGMTNRSLKLIDLIEEGDLGSHEHRSKQNNILTIEHETGTLNINDNEEFFINENGLKIKDNQQILTTNIISATYTSKSNNEQSKDVKTILVGHATATPGMKRANNGTFRGDPARGKRKQLTIITSENQEYIVKEHGRFTINNNSIEIENMKISLDEIFSARYGVTGNNIVSNALPLLVEKVMIAKEEAAKEKAMNQNVEPAADEEVINQAVEPAADEEVINQEVEPEADTATVLEAEEEARKQAEERIAAEEARLAAETNKGTASFEPENTQK